MVSNEKLILLYKETKDSKNKNIIFQELYNNFENMAIKICNYYCRFIPTCHQEDFLEESLQEAKLCLVKCIDNFVPKMGAKFITFYFKGLKNHICNLFSEKIKRINSELSNNPMLEWKDFGYQPNFEEEIDKKMLRGIFDELIEKISFSKPIHKSIFLDYIGFNEDKNTDENFSTLSKKYGLTRMAIYKICTKYIEIAKEVLEKDDCLDKVKTFLVAGDIE